MRDNRTWPLHLSHIIVIVIISVLLGVSLALSSRRPSQAPAAAPLPADIRGLEAFQSAFQRIAAATEPVVVNINTEQIIERRDPLDEFFREQFGVPSPFTYRERMTSLGSGIIIRSDGYILTNMHVISGANQIKVTLSDGKSYQAKPIAVSPSTDLALIKISVERALPAARLGDADKIQVGNWAIAVGSPFGLSKTVTVGVISAKGRILASPQGEYRDLLQTDASINPGNSGGPLLDLRGEVVGVNQAIYSPGRTGNIGIGFAIPINDHTKRIIDQMLAGGK